MPHPISFSIDGKPVGFKRMGGGKRRFKPATVRKYQELVSDVTALHIKRPIRGHVKIEMDFFYPDRRVRDLDNAVKSIFDAMNGIAFIDDSQVTRLVATKSLDRNRPRVEVAISLDDEGTCFARLTKSARVFFEKGGKKIDYLWGKNVDLA